MDKWQRSKNKKRKQREKQVKEKWNYFINNFEKMFNIKLHWYQKQLLKMINNYKKFLKYRS